MARNATKQRPSGSEVPENKEAKQVASWRQERFVEVLRKSGLSDDDIEMSEVQRLVDSDVYPGDLSALIGRGCDPKLAIRILT